MAGDTRSLFESGDRLEQALHAKRRSTIADAEQFDHLLAYLAEWDQEPVINGTPGGERMWSYGGTGTPQIPEFAVCEVAATLGLSPTAAGTLVGDILDLHYRLPALFDALHEGVVEAWRVRKVASATRDFTVAQATEADRRLSAETLRDGTPMLCRVTRSRLTQILDQIRITTRPDKSDDDTETARDERTIRLRPVGTGLAAIDGLLSGEDGQRLDQRLDQIVDWLRVLGDERGTGVLRAVAMGYLAEPDSLDLLHDQICRIRARDTGDTATGDELGGDVHGGGVDVETGTSDTQREGGRETADTGEARERGRHTDGEAPDAFTRERRRRLPQTVVYLHLDRDSNTWSMDGTGPITRTEAADIIGHSHVTVKPVIDLAANLTYTGYLAPPRLKEQTALQNTGLCTFPSCNRPARTADYDHIRGFADGGPTSSRNGHRLCRYHHRCKTFTRWQVQSLAPGVWLWQSPHGRQYLVTAGTTTRLDPREHRRQRQRVRPEAREHHPAA